MRQKIRNTLVAECYDVDLTKLSNLEFYVKQNGFTLTYIPQVVEANKMVVVIPYEDAMQLSVGVVKLQFAFTDENGIPRASEPVVKTVGEFLKEAGYDPV